MHKTINIPLILTLIRLTIAPIIIPILLVCYLPANIFWHNGILALIFLLFSLTDFFDGYLARKLNQVTQQGKILDPIADKFLIFSALVALLAVHKISFFWVIILIGREFFIMGLRQVALERGVSVEVSSGGKLKTVLQVLLITVIILNPAQKIAHAWWHVLERILLYVTVGVSMYSAYNYYQFFLYAIKK